MANARSIHASCRCLAVAEVTRQPNPRPEADSQVVFAVSPIELSSGEPRRRSEFK